MLQRPGGLLLHACIAAAGRVGLLPCPAAQVTEEQGPQPSTALIIGIISVKAVWRPLGCVCLQVLVHRRCLLQDRTLQLCLEAGVRYTH